MWCTDVEHVVNKAFVSGHIHKRQPSTLSIGVMRKAEVNGDAPAFFLRELIRVDSGQCLDERGLAVVDVPAGANDESCCQAHGDGWLLVAGWGRFQTCPNLLLILAL